MLDYFNKSITFIYSKLFANVQGYNVNKQVTATKFFFGFIPLTLQSIYGQLQLWHDITILSDLQCSMCTFMLGLPSQFGLWWSATHLLKLIGTEKQTQFHVQLGIGGGRPVTDVKQKPDHLVLQVSPGILTLFNSKRIFTS